MLETNRRVEFDNGFVEVHDAPTDRHQGIIVFLCFALSSIARQIGGAVRPGGLLLRLWEQKYRQPDVVFLLDRNNILRQENFWDGADLAIEIVLCREDPSAICRPNEGGDTVSAAGRG